ncbi:MAG: hypothetical protein IPN30_09845 [Flavobacteriales bacterium]|nr:hypothetical protein [Flavobacteriales bacterium]
MSLRPSSAATPKVTFYRRWIQPAAVPTFGGTWAIINTGLADTDITESTAGDAALFAITYSDGLFKSTDNGDTGPGHRG